MASSTFNFNGGTDTATIGTPLSPDTGSGYKVTGSSVATYSSSAYVSSARSAKGLAAYPIWTVTDTGGTTLDDATNTKWIDCYLYLQSAPSVDYPIIYGSYFTNAGLAITTDRRFALLNSADSSVAVQTAANAVPLNAWFRVAVKFTTNGCQEARIVTSSAGAASTADYVLTYNCGAAGYLSVGWPQYAYLDDLTIQDGTSTGIPSAGATTWTADASLTATASRTATAALTKFGDATHSTTATITASATVTRAADASLSGTATVTAAAARDAVVGAAFTSTATITAAASVTTPGAISGDVSLTATAGLTAAALLARAADATLTGTATVIAAASVSSVQTGAASSTVTATITAELVNESDVVPGIMSRLDVTGATMSASTGSSTTARMALVAFDAATMTAVVSTEASSPLVGVPVFAGPDDPVGLGLVDAGDAYVWFHDGTVFVSEGS